MRVASNNKVPLLFYSNHLALLTCGTDSALRHPLFRHTSLLSHSHQCSKLHGPTPALYRERLIVIHPWTHHWILTSIPRPTTLHETRHVSRRFELERIMCVSSIAILAKYIDHHGAVIVVSATIVLVRRECFFSNTT